MKKVYKNIEHTGDLGVEVWGRSREELLENAGLALTDLIASVDKIRPRKEVSWTVDAESPEELLVKQLQEILFRLDSEGMVFSEFRIRLSGPDSLVCSALGEPLDRDQHAFKTEIKAATYHRLKIIEGKGKWVARIIFDV